MKAAAIIWMIIFLLWLPIEDTHIWASAALAFGATAIFAFRLLPRIKSSNWLSSLALGALLGASPPLLTIALMAFKSGLHAHGFADFTLRQLSVVLYTIPFTILAGFLIAAVIKLTHSTCLHAKSKI